MATVSKINEETVVTIAKIDKKIINDFIKNVDTFGNKLKIIFEEFVRCCKRFIANMRVNLNQPYYARFNTSLHNAKRKKK